MNFLKTIRSMRSGAAPDAASPDAPPSDADQALTDRYTKLSERQAVAQLSQFNQTELTAIEEFERTHRERDAVLDKLRYLRQPEPLPDYDALEPGAIATALAGADTETIKAVREYERKFQNRPTVNAEIVAAIRRLRPAAAAGADGPPAPDPPEQPLVVGNGLPIKVRPETGLGMP